MGELQGDAKGLCFLSDRRGTLGESLGEGDWNEGAGWTGSRGIEVSSRCAGTFFGRNAGDEFLGASEGGCKVAGRFCYAISCDELLSDHRSNCVGNDVVSLQCGAACGRRGSSFGFGDFSEENFQLANGRSFFCSPCRRAHWDPFCDTFLHGCAQGDQFDLGRWHGF